MEGGSEGRTPTIEIGGSRPFRPIHIPSPPRRDAFWSNVRCCPDNGRDSNPEVGWTSRRLEGIWGLPYTGIRRMSGLGVATMRHE